MLQLVTPPSVEPLSLAEVKAHLRITSGSTAENEDLTRKIAAARRWFEKRTGLALISQEWRSTFDTFPGWCAMPGHLEIPMRPIISIDAVLSVDDAGTETAVDAADYYADLVSYPARVLLVSGAYWPTDVRTHQAGIIEFTAGYGEDPEDVPEDIREAIAQMAGYLYVDREGIGPVPQQVTDTVASYELVEA